MWSKQNYQSYEIIKEAVYESFVYDSKFLLWSRAEQLILEIVSSI